MNNSNWTIDEYYRFFELRARNSNCCAIPGINDDLLNKVVQRLKFVMKPDEKIIFYRDNGLLSRAKSGVLLTDSRIWTLEKTEQFILTILIFQHL